MAEIGSSYGVAAQMALVAELRWRVFRNSLRTWRGQVELVARIFLTVLAGLAAVGIGLGLGAAAYFFVLKGNLQWLVVPLWVVFSCWQVFPVLLAAATVEFDFHTLLRFPLRFSTFAVLSLCYAMLDPAAVTALLWLVLIAAGVLFARPDLFAWIVVVVVVFAAVNLLLNRLIFSWLERLLARRRAREVLFVVLILGAVSFQLFVAAGQRWGRRVEPFVDRVVSAARLLPPGLVSEALTGAARGSLATSSSAAGLLVAYGLGFGLLLHRRLRAQYLGEDVGETPAPTSARAERGTEAAWSLLADRFLPGPVAAVLKKELRYLARIGAMIMLVVLPVIMVAFFALVGSTPRHGPGLFAGAPELMFPAAVAYALLILAPQAHNSLGFDGRGIQLLLVAPVPFRDVLLGKNLAQGLMILGEASMIWGVLSLVSRPPRAMVVAATFAALLFAMLVHFTAGNWLSLHFPRPFDFKRFRQRAPAVTVLAGLGLQILILGSAGAVLFLAYRRGQLWSASVIFLILSAIALRAYLWMLACSSQIAADQREVLLNELCR